MYGVCGEPGNFNISTKDVGPGGLSLSIEGPGKAAISCHDNKDGTISVSYLPTDPGEYKIGVKFGGKHIRGSPYVAKITGTSIILISFPPSKRGTDCYILQRRIKIRIYRIEAPRSNKS